MLFEQFLTWPQNPAEIEMPVHRVDAAGAGQMIGTLTVRNTETGVVFRPDLSDLEPVKRYALKLFDEADCRGPRDGGIAIASLATSGDLWPLQAEENDPNGGAQRNRRKSGAQLSNLPDLVGNNQGRATDEFVVTGMSLADLMQRSIVIHAGDDANSSRWACAAISIE